MIKVCEADMTMTPALLVAEKTRLTERIAKIDIERTRLATELYDIEAAERAMAKFETTGATAQRPRGRPRKPGLTDEPLSTIETKPITTTIKGRRSRGAKGSTGTVSLSDAALTACRSFPGGAIARNILPVVEKLLGTTVRSNHFGAALARHKRAGRLYERDGLWFPPEAEVAAKAA
jgi:hypothetical protein